MQSQLEAALLGHSANANLEDDEKDFQDEEGDDVDDFIDEECDADLVQRSGNKQSSANATTGKTITLQMLLAAGILQPGQGAMTIEYLGQKFVGDLLEDGKIKSQETDIVFASPSAWAIACKRFINPDKKSGCGWASVKYKGRKLDAYKNIWYIKKKELENKQDREEEEAAEEDRLKDIINSAEAADQSKAMAALQMQRIVVKHNTIANRTFTHDANTLIECVPFSNLGKIQPFLITLSTNAALIMDFHCHLTRSEVSGYLAGQWDVNAHNLHITHTFPCRNTKTDREKAPEVEAEISKAIEKEKLILVGWYHSHPFSAAAPTLRDVDAQLEYQIRMKGATDNSYTPCIGIIVSPYNYENNSLESSIIAYWVIPPPESKPNEYGRPMLMSYSVVQDATLPQTLKDEMKKCVDYYQKENDFVRFAEKYTNSATYIEKLRNTLCSKFPRDHIEAGTWGFVKELLGVTKEESDSVLSIPSIGKGSPLLSGLNSNLILTSDIASVLFNSGKFPSATSLLGLPDPMAHSTLAANNMFLSTNLFKMQDLLKPLSTSSPITTPAAKSDAKIPLKIPTDIKSTKLEFPADLNVTKSTKTDFSASDLSISSVKALPKHDFSVSDLSVSNRNAGGDFSLDLSRSRSNEERPAKMPKSDYSSLDLSVSSAAKSFVQSFANIPSDLSVTTASDGELYGSESNVSEQEKPLNLVSE